MICSMILEADVLMGMGIFQLLSDIPLSNLHLFGWPESCVGTSRVCVCSITHMCVELEVSAGYLTRDWDWLLHSPSIHQVLVVVMTEQLHLHAMYS